MGKKGFCNGLGVTPNSSYLKFFLGRLQLSDFAERSESSTYWCNGVLHCAFLKSCASSCC
jgi:hypothetical protein